MTGGASAFTLDVGSSIRSIAWPDVMPPSISSWCSWCSLSVDSNHSHTMSRRPGSTTSIPPLLSSHPSFPSAQSLIVSSAQRAWTSDTECPIYVDYLGVRYFDIGKDELAKQFQHSALASVVTFSRLRKSIERNLSLIESTVAQRVDAADTHHDDNLQDLSRFFKRSSVLQSSLMETYAERRDFRYKMGTWLVRLIMALQGYYDEKHADELGGLIRGYNASARRYKRRLMKAPDEVDPVVLSTLYILDYIVTILLMKEEEARYDRGEGAMKGKRKRSIHSEGPPISGSNVALSSTTAPISVHQPHPNSIDNSHRTVPASEEVDFRTDAADEVPSFSMLNDVNDNVEENAQLTPDIRRRSALVCTGRRRVICALVPEPTQSSFKCDVGIG